MSTPLVIQRTYKASPERIWQALTDPRELRVWWNLPQLTEFEPTPGFVAKFTKHHNGKDFHHIWTITEAIPNQKLSYDWRYEGYPGNSNVTFELEPNGAATIITVTHAGLESFQGDSYPELAITNFEQGWTGLIGSKLKDFVE